MAWEHQGGMKAFKTTVRILVAVFTAFFGALQITMIRHDHRIAIGIVLFALLFSLTLYVLSHALEKWRVPIAVVILLTYAIYGIIDAFGYRLWWLGLVPFGALIAAVGVGLRTRWGTLVTYAISILFTLYWSWEIFMVATGGYFESRPVLEGALSFVPGIAFLLLASFCCYSASRAPRAIPTAP